MEKKRKNMGEKRGKNHKILLGVGNLETVANKQNQMTKADPNPDIAITR